MDAETAWEAMMNQVYRSTDIKIMQKILKLIDAIIGPIPIYRIKCKMDIEAARVAFEAIREVKS